MKNSIKFILLLILASVTVRAQNCSVNAGTAQTICLGENLYLNGSSGGPIDASSLNWSVVSQPAGSNILIANPNSLSTSAGAPLVAGTYVFRLSVKCGDNITTTNDVTYTVNAVPNTPTQSGANSFTCYVGGAISISGTAPLVGETVTWSVGTGLGTFSAPTSSTTNFTPNFPLNECSSSFKIDISYTVRNASGCARSVTRTYTFGRQYTFFAIADPSPVCGNSTVLKGSCAGSGSSLWTVVTTPAGAPAPTFSNATSNNTNVSNLVPGTYEFNYAVTNSCVNNSVTIQVVVASGTGVTIASAGKDQHFCTIPGTISLAGNNPAAGETVTWSLLSGGTPVTFANANGANTTVSGLTDAGAPYTFLYTIAAGGGCSTKGSATIYTEPQLTITNTTLTNCSAIVPTAATTGQAARLGNFGFNYLDTVHVKITYVSGPASFVTPILGGGSSLNASTNSNNNITTLLLGQTFSRSLWNTGNPTSANELYLNRGNSPASNTYYLFFTSTASQVGTYKFKVSYTTKCSTYIADVVVERGTTAAINAGTDVALSCGATTATLAGNIADNYAYWTTVNMPAGATAPINVANQFLKNPNLVGLIDGTYIFRYYNNAGSSCTQSIDDVKIVVSSSAPPTPNAGVDVTQCAGTVTLGGSVIPANTFAQWTVVSPVGALVTFSDPTVSNPTVSGLLPTTAYTFRYTLTNGCGSNFDDVIITTAATSSPSKPTITISGGGCSFLPSFGALPKTSSVTINHTVLSGTQTGTLSLVAVPATALTSWSQTGSTATTKTIQFTLNSEAAISYIWCVSDVNCATQSYCDTATQYYFTNLSGGNVNAGTDQNLCSVTAFPSVINLSGTATTIDKKWSLVYSSNGQSVTFGSATNAATTVTILAEGTYRFKYELISADPACQSFADYITINASSPGSLAQAGPDTVICSPSGTFNLAASPLATGTGKWEIEQVVDGVVPTIANNASATSSITFAQSGTVILRWSSFGSNPTCGASSTDLVTITYVAPAKAGSDISLCSRTSAALSATDASPATGVWSQISGPNTATFANTADPNTLVTGLINGTYTFRWSVNNAGSCITFDDVVVDISNISAVANAGADFSTCNGSTNSKIMLNATVAGTGLTGTWAIASIPSGASAGTFSNVNDPKAIYTGATVSGTYIFSWTLNDGKCSTSDFVAVTVNPATCVTITGTIFDDANGNTRIDGTDAGTAAGTNLYVYLISPSGVIVDSAKVLPNGTYTLDASPSTTYTIELSIVQYPIGTNISTTPIDNTPPAGWVTTGENAAANTGNGDSTANGVLQVSVETTNFTQANFGVEQKPTATAKSFSVFPTAFSNTPPASYPVVAGYASIPSNSTALTGYNGTGGTLSGTDPEDCTTANSCNTGKTFTIGAININTKLYYDFGAGPVLLTSNTIITNYDPARLVIYGQNGSGAAGSPIGFTYSITDVAGKVSPLVTYSIISSAPLPVKLLLFSGTSSECNTLLSWQTANEQNVDRFEIETSGDGMSFSKIGTVIANNIPQGSNYTFGHLQNNSIAYFRLNIVEGGKKETYSWVIRVERICIDNPVYVYPNPVNDYVKITGLQGAYTVEIYSMQGVLMTKVNLNNVNEKTINMAAYSPGIYYLNIKSRDNAINKQIRIDKL